MPKPTKKLQLPWVFSCGEARDDLEWLHHAFIYKKRAGSEALSRAHASDSRRRVAIVNIGSC